MSSFVTSLSPASTTTTSSSNTYAGSYSSAFPPLQSIPLTFQQPYQNNHKKNAHNVNQHPSLYQSLAPPKYPAYLKQTLYADLVLEQYNYYQSKRAYFPSDPNNQRQHNQWNDYSHNNSATTTIPTLAEASRKAHNDGSFSTSSSSSSTSSSSSQHVTYWAEEVDLRLPTYWNQKAKSRHIEIGRNGLDLSYIGTVFNFYFYFYLYTCLCCLQ